MPRRFEAPSHPVKVTINHRFVKSNARQAADSGGPKGLRKARRPRSIRALSTEIRGSTAMEKRSGKRAAKGESPAHLSNQNRVADLEPTEMDAPMRRTGSSRTTDCQN